MDNFERFSDAVRRHLESRSSAFQTWSERGRLLIRTRLFERVWGLVRTRLASRSNPGPFSFSFKHVLAFHLNAFGFSFECISYNDRMRPGCGANAFICLAHTLGQKMHYTLCLTGTVIDVPASINLIISSFSSIVNTTFLRLNFFVILRT